MIEKCAQCGKKSVVLYPHLWVYKRETKFFCSWSCLRAYDKQRREKIVKITPDMKKQAVEAALTGVNPVEFLKEQNVKAPGTVWYHIREWLKKTDPARYQLIPADFKPSDKLKDQLPVVKLTGPIRIETPEANQVTVAEIQEKKPEKKPRMEYKTTGIATEMGDFRYFKRSGYIDWDPVSDLSTTVSLNVDEWRQLIRYMPEVMRILGVPDNDE